MEDHGVLRSFYALYLNLLDENNLIESRVILKSERGAHRISEAFKHSVSTLVLVLKKALVRSVRDLNMHDVMRLIEATLGGQTDLPLSLKPVPTTV